MTNKGCIFSNDFASEFFPAKGGILATISNSKYAVDEFCVYWSSTPTDRANIAYYMICSKTRLPMNGFAEHYYDWLISVRLVRDL